MSEPVATEIHFPLEPQPKHGKPFQIQGDRMRRFYNVNPRYPMGGPLFSYAWSIPRSLDPASVHVERNEEGIYEWWGVPRVKEGPRGELNAPMPKQINDSTLQQIQAVRREWSDVDERFIDQCRSYLSEGKTEYEFWLEYELAKSREALAALQDAISPSRKGMVGNGYYLEVVRPMRARESQIKTEEGQCPTK